MNKRISILAMCTMVFTFSSPIAIAGETTEALGKCMADSTTGKDRKDLAQWIFVAMTTHPEIKPLSNVTESNRIDLDKKLAALATRLLTDNCKVEARAAMQADGSDAFKEGFGVLGRLAMQELMSNPSVNASFSNYGKYLDKAKFDAAFK